MVWSPLRCCGLPARPSRDFVPAADSLSCANKKVSKEIAPAKPPLRGALRCSKTEARPELAPLRSAQTTVRSQFLKRASLAPRPSALLGGLEGGTRQSPTARLRRSLGRRRQGDRVARATLHSGGEPGVQPALTGMKGRWIALVIGTAARAKRVASGRNATGRFRAPLLAVWRSCAVQGLFFGDFLLAPQKKVTPPPGGTPGMGLAINPNYR